MKIAPVVAETRIRASEFDPSQYARGRKHSLILDLHPHAVDIELPVLLVKGAAEGKTLVITAGVHGDEFEGVRAVLEVCADIDPGKMNGTLLAVPVANPPAFWKGMRISPLDQCNLARAFPGREQGTATQVIAFHLGRSIISQADFYLDLHSAGVKLLMPSMAGYDASDRRSRQAAVAFGAPVIWGHPTISPGRTISFAASRGIPWLYTEARGAGRIDDEDLSMFKRGVVNLLRHLNILPGAVEKAELLHSLYGDGDLDASITAAWPGFLVPVAKLLEEVKQGQELGRTLDAHGQVVEIFKSPRDGVVGMIRVFPVVEARDTVFLVTGSAK
jgi:predicted deacylase